MLNEVYIIDDDESSIVIFKELFNSKISVFENFYLKNQYNNSDFEIYNFSTKDLTFDDEFAKIIIQNSKNFNFSQKNKEYIFSIIAESEPPKMVLIYNPKI